MGTKISGQVQEVTKFDGKFGPMYTLVVDGQKYGCGKTSEGAKAGDWVEFSFVTNGKGYKDVEKGTLRAIDAPQGKSAPAKAQGNSNTPYVDTRQDSIILQSSRKDALHFLEIAASKGLVDIGKAKGADALAIYELFLDKYTEHFVAECKQLKTFSSQDVEGNEEAVGKVGDGFDDDTIPF